MITLLSVFSKSYILTLEEKIVAAKKVGFDGVAYVATINDLFFAPNHVLELTNTHSRCLILIPQTLYEIIFSYSLICSL